MIYYIPGLYFWGLCDIIRRFFNCFKKNFLPTSTYFIAAFLHPLWVWYFVINLDLKLYGLAAAGLITNFLNFALMMLLLKFDKELADALVIPNRRSFQDLGTYLNLGIPAVVLTIIDYWEWEQYTLASGIFGIEQ